MVKSFAAEFKANMIFVNAWEIRSMFFDVMENFLKLLFNFAHQQQPTVLFIDDIEGLFGQHDDLHLEKYQQWKREFLCQMESRYFFTIIFE